MALVQQANAANPTVGRRSTRRSGGEIRWLAAVAPLCSIAGLLLIWQLVSTHYPPILLPGPWPVWQRWAEAMADGTLPANTWATVREAGLGVLLAGIVAFPAGYLVAHTPLAERFMAPVLAASQAVPIVAVAPLLIIWLGNGLAPKVAVCALVVVFPLLVSTITGVRGVAREYLEVARVFGAPRWEQIVRVEAPLAAPVLLSGIKLGLTLSFTGAVVGEFVAADQGLGFLVTFSQTSFDTPLLFATLLTLGAIGITLYSAVSVLERIVSRWQG